MSRPEHTINKVMMGTDVLIDLSNDTVTSANDIAAGKYGHLKDGTRVLGTHSGSGTKTTPITYSASGTCVTISGTPAYVYDSVCIDYIGTAATVSAQNHCLTMTNTSVQGNLNQRIKATANTTPGQPLTPESGYDGYGAVNVALPMQSKTVRNTYNTTVTPDSGMQGLTSVHILFDEYPIGGKVSDRTMTGYHFPDGVTEIPGYFFINCSRLTGYEFNTDVTRIGSQAFAYSGIRSVSVNTSVSDLSSIEYEAFSHCEDLESVSITGSNNVSFTGSGIFANCTSLETADISAVNETEYGYNTLASTFSGCSSLINAILPVSLNAIPSNIFDGCTSMQTYAVTNNITDIYNMAFHGCSSLTTLSLGSGITSISGYSILHGCTSLHSLRFYSTPTNINVMAFVGSSLQTIYVPWGINEVPGEDMRWGAPADCQIIHYNS